MTTERISYVEPTPDSGRALIQRAIAGEVVMLNLLRLRKVADYSANPELAPATPISGADAYDRYIAHTLPYLRESGGEVMFFGEGGRFLIGPDDERWDRPCSCANAACHRSRLLRRTRHISPALVIARPRSRIPGSCPLSSFSGQS